MLRQRRYLFPLIGLQDAVERVGEVYRGAKRNFIPRGVVAEHLGYAALNVSASSIISDLFTYGLLSGTSDAMAVTERAVAMIEGSPGDPARVAATLAASQEPLFFKLVADVPIKPLSNEAIRAFLVKERNFSVGRARQFVRAYRETEDYVFSNAMPATPPADPEVRDKTGPIAFREEKRTPGGGAVVWARRQPRNDGERELVSGPLSGTARYRLLVTGNIAVEDIERMARCLEQDKHILADEEHATADAFTGSGWIG